MASCEKTSSDIESRHRQALRRILELVQERNELFELVDDRHKKAYTDDLTGLANRRAFDEKLSALVEIAHQNQEPIAIIFVDIDGLKRVNDNFDHQEGNKVIRTAAETLKLFENDGDLAARLHGDELCLVMPGFRPIEGISSDQLLEETGSLVKYITEAAIRKLGLPEDLYVGAGVGMAMLMPGDLPGDLMRRADNSLLAYKAARKDQLRSIGVVFQDERLLDN
ncbi:hypothetical protein A3F65_03115 [Candidatus Saccharibacteria bacterium RIFCSPHIGHO2_12_FULL_47_16b]|nr:MAG: hypothetical protein A3F65_03115 [Candidatus Saccharibacteria bacterium RIFCSPHIGHO2_12_FULL_47_16b]OGL37990.1 MAG: hypothetical protein A3J32_00080 [Candidatus Saccharibacteria bacterium RIFCSPLOWO2_02_FULL_46_7]